MLPAALAARPLTPLAAPVPPGPHADQTVPVIRSIVLKELP